MNIHDCIVSFVSGEKYSGRAGNVFFKGDVLYSYGEHFPLAVRNGDMFIVNGDKYSMTTSSHQSEVFSVIPNRRRVEIPFSALRSIRSAADPKWRTAAALAGAISVLDWENDDYSDTGRMDKEGNRIYEHALGDCLFSYAGRLWLSGFDSSATSGKLFFLTQLSPAQIRKHGKPKSVSDALQLLKPDAVYEAESEGEEVFRQGEWFFLEYSGVPLKPEKDYRLVHRDHKRLPEHYATLGVRIPRVGQVVQGVVRHGVHKNAEHKMLKLYAPGTKAKDRKWYLALESPQVVSFSAVGNVD